MRKNARGVKQNGRLNRIFPSFNGYFMISMITEIIRRKLFRYASSDIFWYINTTLGGIIFTIRNY